MKKLYLSDKARLLGVCGGIADYIGIDPTVVRLLWIISLFVSAGMSAFVYIVLAFVIPKKPDSEIE